MGGMKFAPVTIKIGYELLGSDDGLKAFATPLATLHKFQGWTDKFLGIPAGGIADAHIWAGGNIEGIGLK